MRFRLIRRIWRSQRNRMQQRLRMFTMVEPVFAIMSFLKIVGYQKVATSSSKPDQYSSCG
ncbi:hypothetical protein BDV26DRAFT_252803 [Aspergillus bertholletiae]|uniref:Uncharacterized protein n=1 Tax=Aspergillus bertholletiae TaxID=1226010 RepID=A0A5N7BMC3_9EURO|nr:hypothetical protein BDV26DRAFT_252803 [Aspergillus bertholletiae]